MMVPYRLYGEKKELVDLTLAAGFAWGHTHVRTQVKNVIINRTNSGYKINITYVERLEDTFDDVLDTFNMLKGNQDMPGSKHFIMKTSNKKHSVEVEVKNLREISSELIKKRNKR